MVGQVSADEIVENMKRFLFFLLLASGLAAGFAAKPVFFKYGPAQASLFSKIGFAPEFPPFATDGRLVLVAGEPFRNLAGLTAQDVSGRKVSFAGGDGASPLTMVSFFSSSC